MRMLVALFVIAITTLGQVSSASVTCKKKIMTSKTAESYLTDVIRPLLLDAMQDPTYPSKITKRISLLLSGIEKNEIEYLAEPSCYQAAKDMLLGTEYDEVNDKPILVAFIPAIQKLKAKRALRPTGRFQLVMAISFAHEYVHIERENYRPTPPTIGEPDPQMAEKDEAEVWGVMVLEMIRPALAQGRWLPDAFRYESKVLQEMNDNYDDPRWIAGFMKYGEK